MAFDLPITNNLSMQEESLLWDVGAECGFLAILMREPNLIIEAERALSPHCFHYTIHKYIYEIMLYIYREAGRLGFPLAFDPMSMLRVAEYVGPQMRDSFLSKTDGMEQVRTIELMKGQVDPTQFGSYVQTLLDRHDRVEEYRMCRFVQKSLIDVPTNPNAGNVAGVAANFFRQIECSRLIEGEGKIIHMAAGEQETLDRWALNANYWHLGIERLFVSIYPFLMGLFNGGFPRKGLGFLCARPKTGKSSWMLATAIAAAIPELVSEWCQTNVLNPISQPMLAKPVPVLYLDTEMRSSEQYSRGISHVSGIHEHSLVRGKFAEDGVAMANVSVALDRMRNAPIYFARIAGLKPDRVQAIMREFRNNYVGQFDLTVPGTNRTYRFSNPALVIYDWLKLPDPEGLKHAQETQLMGAYASSIKDATSDLDMVTIAGAQNNRAAIGADAHDWVEKAESFVAGSDRLAQFCDWMGILRNVTMTEAESILEKLPHREGRHGHGILKFNQMLHLVLQRAGGDYRTGVPLYLDRGYARYFEVADAETLAFSEAMQKRHTPAARAHKEKLPPGQANVESSGFTK